MAPAVVAYYDTFLVYVLAMLVAYVLTCAWLHLARRNSEVLNPTYGHRHSVGWVWGSWLVPVVSLWFPYQVVADIHAASSTPGRRVPWLLRAWWAAWLLLTIALNLTSTVLAETSWEPPIQSLGALFSVVALVAWIGIVREISRGQTAAATALGWSPALALGELATAGVGAAPTSPGMADSRPPTVSLSRPRGHSDWSPWPTARLFRLHRLSTSNRPRPTSSRRRRTRCPLRHTQDRPTRVPLRWAPDRLIPAARTQAFEAGQAAPAHGGSGRPLRRWVYGRLCSQYCRCSSPGWCPSAWR